MTFAGIMALYDFDPRRRTVRWNAKRKAALVDAVRHGLMDASQAMILHDLSEEELSDWTRKFSEGGVEALRAKNVRGHCEQRP